MGDIIFLLHRTLQFKTISVTAWNFLHLVKLWRSRVGPNIQHVDPGGDERRQDQAVPLLGGVIEAAATGIPARVVQLVTEVWHRQTVDDLQG